MDFSDAHCGQLPLFQRTIAAPGDFESYDRANPAIWQEFEGAALELIRCGIEHYGAKAILEYIRYGSAVRSRSDVFKVNNNFTTGYARKFIAKYPRHRQFFELREKHKGQKHE